MKTNGKPSAGGIKLTWSTHESLRLHSEKIQEFLSRRMLSQDAEYAKAVDFFKKIRLMMDDSSWVITPRKAEFRALNRTGGTIRSVQATVDFFTEERLFHVADLKRTFIESNQQFEFSEDILGKVYEACGVIRDEYGQPRGLKRDPQLSCGFREYTVEIPDKHRMFGNEYVRAVAGLIPMRKDRTELEEFTASAFGLSGDLKAAADRVTENLARLLERAEEQPEISVRVEGFISRYLPTATRAITAYCAGPEEKKAQALAHTLEVMIISTGNLYKSVSGSEDDAAQVEQKILEQQLIREGLYSPFEQID